MAKILLNTRASRITIVDNILLLPAEIKDDENLGKVVKPSKTLISERSQPGLPSPYERITQDRSTLRLIASGVLQWSDEKAEEPEPVPNVVSGPNPLPREGDKNAKRRQADPAADVDGRALIDESGTPLEALAQADTAVVRAAGATGTTAPAAPPGAGATGVRSGVAPAPTGATAPSPEGTTGTTAPVNPGAAASGTQERVHTDEARDALPHGSKAKGGHSKGG